MSVSDFIALGLPLVAFFFPFSISLTNCSLGILMFSTFYLTATQRGPWKPERKPAIAALAIYSIVGMLVSVSGLSPWRSLHETGKDWHKPLALFVMLTTLGFRPKLHLERVFAFSFGLAALIGLFQSATQRIGDAWLRAHAFVHPVTYGEMMACAVLGGACFWGRKEAGLESPLAKRCASGFLVLAYAALVLNQTRAAVIGLAAGFAAVCWFDKTLRRWAIPAVVLLISTFGVWEIMPTGGRNLETLLLSQSAPGTLNPSLARWQFWSVAWRVFLDHPWFGVGQGNFKTVFGSYISGINYNQDDFGSAHNLYLHQLAERGIVGFAALAAALGVLTLRAYRRASANPNAWNLWAWGAIVGFLAMNITEVAFQNELATTLILFVWAWAETNKEISGVKSYN